MGVAAKVTKDYNSGAFSAVTGDVVYVLSQDNDVCEVIGITGAGAEKHGSITSDCLDNLTQEDMAFYSEAIKKIELSLPPQDALVTAVDAEENSITEPAAVGDGNLSISSQQVGSTTNDVFQELFAKHEQYFRSIAERRQESFKRLEESINSVSSEIRNCKEKNAKMKVMIKQLDELIEKERKEWRDRLDSEKKGVFQTTN